MSSPTPLPRPRCHTHDLIRIVSVEGGVEQDGDAGEVGEGADQAVVAQVLGFGDGLQAAGSILKSVLCPRKGTLRKVLRGIKVPRSSSSRSIL